MDELTFYPCVGGPLDGIRVTMLQGQQYFKPIGAAPEVLPSALEGEDLVVFGRYQLLDHPQFGKAWFFPLPVPFDYVLMHSAGDQQCHARALLIDPQKYRGDKVSHENFQTLDGKPYPPYHPLLCGTCGVQIVNPLDCLVMPK
ncbi:MULTISPECIES: hypothetical protein [unclassified Pseudomonas]|uniref:hypothetical protein n=1 Tax=unclassified Pseudomonas TaxID=196821 RepID=UPI000C88649E|nr:MULTISPECIES: hypothetical protein [unclassified Pseudomonas]PMZ72459.1 hypothetical protein C1X25_11325 [Pseudomonas sp. GW247-3R2A]PMY73086.1 hypothetical protein C1X26_12830 [Pseudomonas sp. MPR-R3A]PMY97943.1 hypothetical protein C1X24_12110 [Pseudomonas sp. FW305-124]PNA91768.1 hypothetical protein C1X23_16755 [Pseudomonas sp. FW300-E2]PNB02860.1 hypothetical protein C1X27_11365 [Pseudomonas sp. MPR-AND1B]